MATRTKKPPVEAPEDEPVAQIAISQVQAQMLLVPLVGTSPLIVSRFSEKAKRQMLDAMQGRKKVKEPKNPEAEYEAAFYRFKDEGRFGMPVGGFLKATIGAARFYDKSVTMTALRQFIFMDGEVGADGLALAVIEGTPEMREDVVRVQRGTDLRYRPMFPEWSTTLSVTYVTSALTEDSVLSLIDAGGMGVGVGEWRPERSGPFGRFRIDTTRSIEHVKL